MIEDLLSQASPKTLALGVAGVWIVILLGRRISTERKIQALGGHAPKVKTWVPYDIDLIVRGIRDTMNHQNMQGWLRWFNSAGRWTVEASPAGRRVVFTADPENIKAILATQFTDYGKGKPFHDEWQAFLGDSIFTTDGDMWHNSRQLIRPQFIKDRVSDLGIFEEHTQILIKQIKKHGLTSEGKQGKELEVSDLFFRYTLDASTHFLLGRSVDSLEIQEQEFAEAFSEAQRVQNIITRAGPLNMLIPRKTFNESIKVINEFVNPFIEKTLSFSQEELATKTKSEEGYNFLYALASYTRDRKLLRDQLVAVLLAGRDTTASTLSWTFYELARAPEITRKLREEIIQQVGLERAPTYDDLKAMKYLQYTMHETLRLYPSVPFNVRLALKDTTLPRGGGPDGTSPVAVLKDTPIGYSAIIMQRRVELYPPVSPTFAHPSVFSPDRWANWQPKPWQYIPFNGGPRICVGQQFALTEMGYTIVRLLQTFDKIENHMAKVDQGDPCLKAEIVLQPGQGVRVAFMEREKGEKA